jgi:hypothetical protein
MHIEENKETIRLLRSFEALRAQRIQRCCRPPETEQSEIITLIENASISKVAAIGLAGVPRSTYYRLRKLLQTDCSLGEQQLALKHEKLTDCDSVKEAVFRAIHSPPSEHGFNRATSRLNDLQPALQMSGLTVGRHAIRT